MDWTKTGWTKTSWTKNGSTDVSVGTNFSRELQKVQTFRQIRSTA